MEKNKMIRIKDIAKLSGVSVGTVDRVIHKRGKVSEAARQKVEKVLKEIDYTPNLLAKTLGSSKVYKIALLVPNPKQDPYWNLSLQGLEASKVEWRPYHMVLEPHFFELHDFGSFKSASKKLMDSKPDAVLSAPIFLNEALEFFKELDELNIPYVHFNTMIPDVSPLAFIGQDLYQSGRLGASLINLGTDCNNNTVSILHVSESIQFSVHFKEKERGFRDYFSSLNNGIVTVSSVIIEGDDMKSFESKLIEAIKKDKIKGLFIPTSSGAKLTAEILRKNKLSDMCIVGYDLLEENVELLKSGDINFLINQNPNRQVFRGIHHLANLLLFNKQAPEKELFPLEVITRENVDSYIKSTIH
ncbi:LacI family DNA-binding transcriptional regulator [Echinicola sp. CAU 1574]|uniref:LacI family DNA-binding transcriptional regulator n=1 Tax=Echinicola arenosa TaxID=2774144 RepID=A0ABR9AFX5_9BACT|nr:LacI family DNA-binding transcriptional regulator [Echinicola arenosa]MBD8487131.1 LacI family DNA-binding transcriptional regulator [Echinicola arenosa]